MVSYQNIMAFSRIKNHKILIKPFLHNNNIFLNIRLDCMQVFTDSVQSIAISIIAWITISYEKEDVI